MTIPLDVGDVPYSEDLQSVDGARAWAETADAKRPERIRIRAAILDQLGALPAGARILELGSGPGLLAADILQHRPDLAEYTLFDFSEPMLEMSRMRVGRFAAARYVLGDFRSEEWAGRLGAPYHAVVSLQAVHEVRHKQRVPRLYRQIRDLLVPGGLLLVSDRLPLDETERSRALFMTGPEQRSALAASGFERVEMVIATDALALYRCEKPAT